MQRDRFESARTWLETARRDLRVARTVLDVEPSLAAFHAQQGAEKALKATLVALADDHPRTHTATRLVRELRSIDPTVDESLEADASSLDLYYLSARYPDAVGDEDPGDIIRRGDAAEAISRAERVLLFAEERIARASG